MLRVLALALAAACAALTSVSAQAPPLFGSDSFRTLYAYDALLQIYNSYKFNGHFADLQVPFTDDLVYAVCFTHTNITDDAVFELHPVFPIGKPLSDWKSQYPLAPNVVEASYEAANDYLGDRQLQLFTYPYGSKGQGSEPTFNKTSLGVIIYGNLKDVGKIYSCSIGVDDQPL